MKKALYIILICLIGCGPNKSTEQMPRQETNSETQDKQPTSSQISYTTYKFIDEPNAISQTLVVEWLTKDSIKFQLFTETDLCNYHEHGTAVLKEGTEIDEDEKGMSYMTKEYVVVDAGKLWGLRIPEPERDKAKITYVYDDIRDECDPFDKLMKKTNLQNLNGTRRLVPLVDSAGKRS